MNKPILIALTIFSNSLLIGQNTPQNPIKKPDTIKISPTYLPTQNNLKSNIPASENNTPVNNPETVAPKKTNSRPLIKPSRWLLESALANAPELLKGIIFYLQTRSDCNSEEQALITVPSCHRFILVGPPGSGKTTLAYAIADMLNCATVVIGATNFLGDFRNQTANNIRKTLTPFATNKTKTVIIIDEIHKLFENHKNERSDDSQSAAAFWLILDDIEKRNPNTIIIGTANNVEKLPPEIKSRFSGKIINMPYPTKNQKLLAFKNISGYDQSIELDKSITDSFIIKTLEHIPKCSLRDIQLIIDTAKMFSYAKTSSDFAVFPIVLTKAHFQQALDQLKLESYVLQESFSSRLCKTLQPWGVVFGIAANICTLARASSNLYKALPMKNDLVSMIEGALYKNNNNVF